MSSLSAFLNPVKVENKKVVISNRFVENEELVPFEIKPITQEENKLLIKKFTKKEKKNGQIVESFDRAAYLTEMVVTSVVFPDLSNAELQKAYGVLGAGNLIQKMLYMGEFATLLDEIQTLSGLEVDVNEDIEEAKN